MMRGQFLSFCVGASGPSGFCSLMEAVKRNLHSQRILRSIMEWPQLTRSTLQFRFFCCLGHSGGPRPLPRRKTFGGAAFEHFITRPAGLSYAVGCGGVRRLLACPRIAGARHSGFPVVVAAIFCGLPPCQQSCPARRKWLLLNQAGEEKAVPGNSWRADFWRSGALLTKCQVPRRASGQVHPSLRTMPGLRGFCEVLQKIGQDLLTKGPTDVRVVPCTS